MTAIQELSKRRHASLSTPSDINAEAVRDITGALGEISRAAGAFNLLQAEADQPQTSLKSDKVSALWLGH